MLGVCVYFLINNNFVLTGLFIVLIWISDLLDGFFARMRNEISELGKLIDPLADKIVIITLVIILLLKGIIPEYFVIIIISRDIIILLGGLYLKYRKNIILQSNWIGKITVFSIGFTLILSIFNFASKIGQFGNYFFYHCEITELLYIIMLFISIVLTFLSLFSYFQRFKETK